MGAMGVKGLWGSIDFLIIDSREKFPPQMLPKTFNPIITAKDVGEGTGLGLTISYRIIQNHQGPTEVAETGKPGTTFEITLPYQQA